MSAVPTEAKREGTAFSGTGLRGSCVFSDADAENQTQLLCKNSKCSQPLNNASVS